MESKSIMMTVIYRNDCKHRVSHLEQKVAVRARLIHHPGLVDAGGQAASASPTFSIPFDLSRS